MNSTLSQANTRYITMQRTISSINYDESSLNSLPIAEGLPDIPTPVILSKFNPEKLKTGTDVEKEHEKKNWQYGKDVSVYVSWIPDELLPERGETNGPANAFFGRFGKISRIEFVPKFSPNRKQSGHMAFIHYDYLYSVTNENSIFAKEVAAAHPVPYEVDFTTSNRFGKRKDYKLKCCINIAAISKVEYNASQLTDMFERLNKRVTEQLERMQREIFDLREENSTLRTSIAEFQK